MRNTTERSRSGSVIVSIILQISLLLFPLIKRAILQCWPDIHYNDWSGPSYSLIQVYRYKRRVKISASVESKLSKLTTTIMTKCIFRFVIPRTLVCCSVCLDIPVSTNRGCWMADILWFIGYASLVFLLYSCTIISLEQNMNLWFCLIAVIISTALILVLDIIVSIAITICSTSRFLDLLSTLVYPILDAALIFQAY